MCNVLYYSHLLKHTVASKIELNYASFTHSLNNFISFQLMDIPELNRVLFVNSEIEHKIQSL